MFLSYWCPNKFPQMQWLKPTDLLFLQFCRSEFQHGSHPANIRVPAEWHFFLELRGVTYPGCWQNPGLRCCQTQAPFSFLCPPEAASPSEAALIGFSSFLHLQVPQWQVETLSHLESPLPLPLQMSRTGQGSLPSFRSLCRVM